MSLLRVRNGCRTRKRTIVLLAMILALSLGGQSNLCRDARAAEIARRPYNVLLVCVDDLRPQLSCYGVEGMITPNLDRLAAGSRRFNRHYVQIAVCGPSRCSLLTGTRQGTWDCWRDLRKLKEEPERPVSIAHLFRRAGWRTTCIGKVSHEPGGVIGPEAVVHQVPFSWDLAYAPVGKWKTPWGAFFCYADGSFRAYGYGRDDRKKPAYEMADVPDEGYADGLNAAEAIEQLRANKDRRFFLAVGFYKPHLPLNSPKKYWDLYDPAKIELAPNPFPPKGVDPKISMHPSFELTTHYAWPSGPGNVDLEQARTLRHAYCACVSYVDAQIGKVLDELRRLGLEDDTIVVLWGDHGWHLGDHGMWGKQTNFEVATRSPLMIRVPGMPQAGRPTDAVTETVDVYPTLADLCGLEPPSDLAGRSLRPVLEDPTAPGKDAAMSFHPRGQLLGCTLRTEQWRLVEWVDRKTGKTAQVELYDHRTDPEENVNVAGDHPEVVEQLRKRLQAIRPTLRNI